jgi:hypothetical protein
MREIRHQMYNLDYEKVCMATCPLFVRLVQEREKARKDGSMLDTALHNGKMLNGGNAESIPDLIRHQPFWWVAPSQKFLRGLVFGKDIGLKQPMVFALVVGAPSASKHPLIYDQLQVAFGERLRGAAFSRLWLHNTKAIASCYVKPSVSSTPY